MRYTKCNVCFKHMFSILILTLPTQPNAIRVRVWRSLKALGCGALRDGAYLLPAERGALFDPLVQEVQAHGGTASVLDLSARNPSQRDEMVALFDRSEAYAQWQDSAAQLKSELESLGETEARRRWRSVAESLQNLIHIDYFPKAAPAQAQAALDALRQALDARFSHGEPTAVAAHGVERLDISKFQKKRWATRARPWVDRLACAWLIRRFIDPTATFLWLKEPSMSNPAPRGALSFDYDGARFTHVGVLVTFEVLLASFGLDEQAPLQRMARVIRYLDAGGIPAPEAAGLETVLSGLRELHGDDDELVKAASAVFDAMHAAPQSGEARPS